MKRKIVGIFVCTLLIVMIIPSFGTINEQVNGENLVSSYFPLAVPVFVKIDGIDGESKIIAGLRITITNTGDEIIQDIDWTFNTSGGIIIFGDGKQGGRLPISLHPMDETTVILRPAPRLFPDTEGQSPIGIGVITMEVTLQATVGSTIDSASVTSNAFLLGPIILTNLV